MQDTKTAVIRNGVNVSDLIATIEAVQETPTLANFVFRNTNRWLSGGHNRSSIKSFYGAGQEDTTRKVPFVLDNDEPPVLLGKDNGANPVEYVLHALAGCITTTMVYHAAAQGIEIDEVESTYEGDLDLHGFLGLKDVTRGYRKIKIIFTIKGDLDQAKKREILATGQRYSPVFDMISKAVPIEVTLV